MFKSKKYKALEILYQYQEEDCEILRKELLIIEVKYNELEQRYHELLSRLNSRKNK